MKTLPEVIASFPTDIQTRYDFTQAAYQGAVRPIQGIVCAAHGVFQQYPGNLRKGVGCPMCGAQQRARSRSAHAGDFFARARDAHQGKYTYPAQPFTNMHTHVDVCCAVHGLFKIKPLKHLYQMQGCPQCGAARRGHRTNPTTSAQKSAASKVRRFAGAFAEAAEAVHGVLYDYSNVAYTRAQDKVVIVCKTHGAFMQTPEHHIKRGYGCPACGNAKSKGEEELAAYVRTFHACEVRDRKTIGPKELDVYVPCKKIAFEYSGMYWHSHFDREDERKHKHRHADKYRACIAQGVRLITVYEAEWQTHKKAVQRLIRNALGKSKGRLMARKCQLLKVDGAEARAFYDRYHPQGGAGSGEHYGLYWKGKLVACMRFSFGQNDRGAGASGRTWTLGRYATRVNVAGAASRLFTAFVNDFRPKEVKSFSDNRYFAGNMYAQLGFVLEAEVAPDYQVWSPKIGLRPKTHYQRRSIPARLQEHGIEDTFDPATDARTESGMTYLMKCGRIYDCGKKRWVWTAPTPV